MWSYRIIEKEHRGPFQDIRYFYEIHQVFYDEDSGEIVFWTELPARVPSGSTQDELEKELMQMLKDCGLSVLKLKDLQTEALKRAKGL